MNSKYPFVQSETRGTQKELRSKKPKATNQKNQKLRKHNRNGKDIRESGTALFGIDIYHVELFLEVILEEENKKTAFSEIDWQTISSKVLSKIGHNYPPEIIQRIWKYLSYGQLFANSKSEIIDVQSNKKNVSDWITLLPQPPCNALPSSDEDEFLCSPDDYNINQVNHSVAIVKKKKVKTSIDPPPLPPITLVTSQQVEVSHSTPLTTCPDPPY
mmetsp:Transcript_10406/g.12642  ORF Transcript_10406/g.12642 Transcript_10406/m.12642 type:complete len:215 (-) Transcript_10406:286-930(-)